MPPTSTWSARPWPCSRGCWPEGNDRFALKAAPVRVDAGHGAVGGGGGPMTTGGRQRSTYRRACVAALVVTAAFVTWLHFGFGGDAVTIAVDDYGEAVAAFLAAGACLRTARRSDHRSRTSWRLL